MSTSLVMLGCSQRKRQTSRLLPAIDRYDGPAFRVLRKHARAAPENTPDTYILSARFGLISGDCLIPRYDRDLTTNDCALLRQRVEKQLKRTLDKVQPERVFVSVGSRYWPLLEEPLAREIASTQLVVASGGIGGRASQLAHWLRSAESESIDEIPHYERGEAMLLGTTVRLRPDEVFQRAREALLARPVAAHRFETWYVAVGHERVAPKWLVSVLFGKPVARFRTADARRVLSSLGICCLYVSVRDDDQSRLQGRSSECL